MRLGRPLTLKVRIAVAFFAGSLAVSGLVSVATYVLARTYLSRQRTDSVLRQSYNSLRFATESLSQAGPGSLEELVTALHTRGDADVIIVDGDRTLSSSVSVTLASLPRPFVSAVSRQKVAYTRLDGDSPRMIVGSPVPNTSLQAFFVYSLQELASTLRLLERIFLAVVGVTVAVAGVLGLRLAARTLSPLRDASDAARKVAQGLIDTRLEVRGRDELGSFADAFNEMARALQERIARERRFVGDASHELRTPLTSLKASIDHIASQADQLPDRLAHAARRAAAEVGALRRLVADLLELSAVESGRVELVWEDVDLVTFAHQAARRRAPGVAVTVDGPDEPVMVRVDKARLERIVGNLLENAAVHGQGRDVRLAVRRTMQGAEIEVSDRGPGIAVEETPRIFERFWRGDRARSRGPSTGSGLGLAIAVENAAHLGAELNVTTQPGAGAAFVVRLPDGLHRAEAP